MKKQRYSALVGKHFNDIDYKQKLDAESLAFLEAFEMAEFGGSINELKKMRQVPDKLKKEFSDQHNARRRDIYLQNSIVEYVEHNDCELKAITVPTATLGEMVDGRRAWSGKQKNKNNKAK